MNESKTNFEEQNKPNNENDLMMKFLNEDLEKILNNVFKGLFEEFDDED